MSVKACEGLMLIASIPNDDCAKHMLADTEFIEQTSSRLCSLYCALPKVMDPADIEFVDAKWGSVCLTHHLGFVQLACFSVVARQSIIFFYSGLSGNRHCTDH